MIHTTEKATLTQALCWSGIICTAVMILKDPHMTTDNIVSTLRLCAGAVIPSLFPFLVINGILISSGFAELFGAVAGGTVKRIFRLNRNCAVALFIGAVAGFPAGVACTVELYDKGLCSNEEAELLCGICNNAGPAFVIGAVGSLMLGDTRAGVVLYISQLISSLAVGILLTRCIPHRISEAPPHPSAQASGFAASVPSAIASASRSMLYICGSVVFFSLMTEVISRFTYMLPAGIQALAAGALEITSGVLESSRLLSGTPRYCTAALSLGWAGISVHMQSALVISGRFRMKYYYLTKLLTSVTCVLLATSIYLLMQ